MADSAKKITQLMLSVIFCFFMLMNTAFSQNSLETVNGTESQLSLNEKIYSMVEDKFESLKQDKTHIIMAAGRDAYNDMYDYLESLNEAMSIMKDTDDSELSEDQIQDAEAYLAEMEQIDHIMTNLYSDNSSFDELYATYDNLGEAYGFINGFIDNTKNIIFHTLPLPFSFGDVLTAMIDQMYSFSLKTLCSAFDAKQSSNEIEYAFSGNVDSNDITPFLGRSILQDGGSTIRVYTESGKKLDVPQKDVSVNENLIFGYNLVEPFVQENRLRGPWRTKFKKQGRFVWQNEEYPKVLPTVHNRTFSENRTDSTYALVFSFKGKSAVWKKAGIALKNNGNLMTFKLIGNPFNILPQGESQYRNWGMIFISSEDLSAIESGQMTLELRLYNEDNIDNIEDETKDYQITFNELVFQLKDTDSDGIPDNVDNCPYVSNSDQEDADGNGTGDACETVQDSDGDGVSDDFDVFPDDPSEWEDSDGDGVGDNSDLCPGTPSGEAVNGDGCSDSQLDDDSGDDGSGDDFSLMVNPKSLVFYALKDGASPDEQYLSIQNRKIGSRSWSSSSNQSWMSLSPANDGTPSSLEVSIDIDGLATGTYNAVISIWSTDDPDIREEISVQLNVNDSDSPVVYNAMIDTYVESLSISPNGSKEQLLAGYNRKNNLYMQYLTFIKFNLPSFEFFDKIESARLKLYCNKVVKGGQTYTDINVYRATENWNNYTTWDNKPTYDNTIGSGSREFITSTGWVDLDVTNIVSQWVNGTNNGFFIMGPTPTAYLPNTEQLLYFDSKEGVNKPKLEIKLCEGESDLSIVNILPDKGETSPPFFSGQSVKWYVDIFNNGPGCHAGGETVEYYIGNSADDYSNSFGSSGTIVLSNNNIDRDRESYTFKDSDAGTQYINVKILESDVSISYGPFEVLSYTQEEYDADDDGDGVRNVYDAFPNDPLEWEDTDGDGVGDNSDFCSDTPSGETVNEGGCSESQQIQPAEPFYTNSLDMHFMKLPAGTFLMGSPADEPGREPASADYPTDETQHQVTLTENLYMQTTEVTQGQWESVMGTNPSLFQNCGADCPVNNVSWEDAQQFIAALNLRGEGTYGLPTEAQWEYAARAGSTNAFANGPITNTGWDHDPVLDTMGWYHYNNEGDTIQTVAQKQPNAWGLFDMHGNVAEWVADWLGSYPDSPVTDPQGPESGESRVIRGGYVFSPIEDCRSAFRDFSSPDFSNSALGFRLVLISADQEPFILLSKNSISLQPGDMETVSIIGGTGPYTVISDNDQISTASLNGTQLEITGLSAGTATITVEDIDGGATATITVMVPHSCGAYVAPGVWKEFDCYNLAAIGKTTNDNPFTPSWRLIGGYWQWGRKGPDPTLWYDTNTPYYAHGPTGPELDDANTEISGWDHSTFAPYGAWSDESKTINDPCPSGFRVPSENELSGLISSNNQSITGSWIPSFTNYSSGLFFGNNLMLPAAGLFTGLYVNAFKTFFNSAASAAYWSSTISSDMDPFVWFLGFYFDNKTNNDVNVFMDPNGYFQMGNSIRCIAEDQPVIEVDKTEVTLLPDDMETVKISGGTGNYTVILDNDQICTASLNGNSLEIIGLSAGTATITVEDTDGSTATITVMVPNNCGAYVSPGVWKEFDCYNLAAIGKITNDDPFTPSWRLIGGYWQWGRKGPDHSQWYNTNTPHFAHGPTGPDSGDANSGYISGWDRTSAPDGAWSDNHKTANDPCLEGFRVPTRTQWAGVRNNNTQSTVGTWTSTSATNYSSGRFFGSDLMLLASGRRHVFSGPLSDRGNNGNYWSSSEDSGFSSAWYLSLDSGIAYTSNISRKYGNSVRCIAQQKLAIEVDKTEVTLFPGDTETVIFIDGTGDYTVNSYNEKVAIASITDDYLEIIGLSIGTARIIVEDTDGSKATITVIVTSDDNLPDSCGAYIAPGVWKEFDCYNLAAQGKRDGDDPFTPSWKLTGGYWQWGRKGPDPGVWYTTNTANFAHGPTGPDSGDANSGYISGWDQTEAPDGGWKDDEKTANDPCPEGFRVPTRSQWDGVRNNNPQSTVGVWSTTFSDPTNYSIALFFGDDLMLQAAGYREYVRGSLAGRGYRGYYWSSSEYSSSNDVWGWVLQFGNGYARMFNKNRGYGFSVRCVAKDKSVIEVDKTEVTLLPGGMETLVFLDGAGDYTVNSDNEEVAIANITNDYLEITSLSAGTTTITVKDADGRTADITVTVTSDHTPDLKDSLTAMQVISGQPYDVDVVKDINADEKVGLLEAIYPLQVLSGLNEKLYTCGAYVAPGVWKDFDCYNLAAIGKDLGHDPFSPSWSLIGGYWQWGRKGPDPSQWYDTNTKNFAHGPTGPDSGDANSGSISGWDSSYAPEGAWSDAAKTVNDPCPAGFRVPTKSQWDGVLDNNTQSKVGTWLSSATNYRSARFFGNDLMLQSAGYRSSSSVTSYHRGYYGYYWGSSEYGSLGAWYLRFGNSYSGMEDDYRRSGFSVRCVAE